VDGGLSDHPPALANQILLRVAANAKLSPSADVKSTVQIGSIVSVISSGWRMPVRAGRNFDDELFDAHMRRECQGGLIEAIQRYPQPI
jgi:hypothetical protein